MQRMSLMVIRLFICIDVCCKLAHSTLTKHHSCITSSATSIYNQCQETTGDACQEGTYQSDECSLSQITCVACPKGTFMPSWNNCGSCIPCSTCPYGIQSECRGFQDTVCGPIPPGPELVHATDSWLHTNPPSSAQTEPSSQTQISNVERTDGPGKDTSITSYPRGNDKPAPGNLFQTGGDWYSQKIILVLACTIVVLAITLMTTLPCLLIMCKRQHFPYKEKTRVPRHHNIPYVNGVPTNPALDPKVNVRSSRVVLIPLVPERFEMEEVDEANAA